MGDHRATIKIEFQLPNKTYKTEIGSMGGINYFPDSDGIDHRVSEFFSESWDDYMHWYNEKAAEHFEKEHAAEIEAAEKAELARLQAKYETSG